MDNDEEYLKVVELIRGDFSVEEDLLLIECLDIKRHPWEDTARNYLKKKSQYNKILLYNKEPHQESFLSHLHHFKASPSLSHEGRRWHYMKKYCIIRDPPEKKESVLEKAKMRRWMQEQPTGKRQQMKLGSEKLELCLIGKHFAKTSIHTYKKPLLELSDVIKAMVDKAEDNIITLSEKVSKYSNFDNFNHFHPDIVSRFILFCVNDVYSQQYESMLDARHEEYIKKLDSFRNEYHLTLDADERSHLRVLSQQKREEQQKEWAHWDAITPLTAFLNSSPSPSLTSSSPPPRALSSSSPSPTHLSRSSRSLSKIKNNNSTNNLTKSSGLNKSKGDISINNSNNKRRLQSSSSGGSSSSLVKSERFGDLSFTPAPVHSSSTASLDMREITTKNRKIQAQKFAKIKNILQQHYKQQKEAVNEIVSLLVKRHHQKMEDKKSESIQLYNYIFNKKQVVQLLILAEDIICEDLRQVCIQCIASSIDAHVNSPPLRCMLLREETYIAILSRLPISTLMTIVPGSSIPSSIVSRELSYRKLLIKDQVNQMSFDELQKVSDTYDSSNSEHPSEILPFMSMIDIVKDDLAFRKETYPIVELSCNDLPEGIEVAEDRLTISATYQKRYCVARANHAKGCTVDSEMERERAGKWYFEVSILEVDPNCDASISIGWDVERPSSERCIPGLNSGYDNKHGYCVQIDGIMHYEGKGEYFGPKSSYGQGDVIGCGIDQINNYLYFYKNGVKISSKTNHGNFPIRPPYEFVPCVTFYTQQEAKVKFNFSGPFVSLPTGFKSYGRAPTSIAR